MFEDTRSRKSKKDKQHNDQKKTDNRTKSVLPNITQKVNDQATRTTLKTGVNSCAPEG